jgi:Protein of unknown function (DUF4013)
MSATTLPPAGPEKTTLDFARAFRFVFDDPDWVKKVLLGSLFTLLSAFLIGGVFLAGYVSRLIQRTSTGEAHPLPEWDDLGDLFGSGLRALGAYLVHMLAVALPALGVVLLVALVSGGLAAGNREVAESLGPLAGLGLIGAYAFAMLGMLALLVYFPAALTRLALSERFGAAFEVSANVAFIRRNLMNYGLAIVFYLVASFASQFGILLCCVGVLPASFWSLCVFGFSLGETARLGGSRLGD